MPPRVLIITASIGEGRDLAACALADQLREERPGVELETADCVPATGRIVSAEAEGAPRTMFFRLERPWDLGFTLERALRAALRSSCAPGLCFAFLPAAASQVLAAVP